MPIFHEYFLLSKKAFLEEVLFYQNPTLYARRNGRAYSGRTSRAGGLILLIKIFVFQFRWRKEECANQDVIPKLFFELKIISFTSRFREGVVANLSFSIEIDDQNFRIGDGSKSSGLRIFKRPSFYASAGVSFKVCFYCVRLTKPFANLGFVLNPICNIIYMSSIDLLSCRCTSSYDYYK